ncbi:MAG TPA: NAD(P)-dependent oxidoreductase, partial [Candidatus Limnocylindrales bacterium]|nr:NAD(P)-dependent oxidoreductase [Candidatus Limnocylindrales bacterium]
MRILVLGDSYCPSTMFRPAFGALAGVDGVDYDDLVDEPAWRPATPSEHAIKEILGSPEQVIARLGGQEILVVQGAPVTDAVLDAAPIKLVAVARGGPVNIDLAAAAERGIPVVTTPGKNATAVAELTIACLVLLARQAVDAIRWIDRGGEFGIDNYEGARWLGHDLAGHTLGLVGFGQVGRRVAARAAAFEMRILAHDPYMPDDVVRAGGAEPVSLDALVGESDHISLHARLSADNRGLFDARRFAQMRPGATFVNTARAELADETALHDALVAGHLAGAAVDVASGRAAGAAHPLVGLPNVIVLPHIGGATVDTLETGGRLAAAEVARFIAGEPLVN